MELKSKSTRTRTRPRDSTSLTSSSLTYQLMCFLGNKSPISFHNYSNNVSFVTRSFLLWAAVWLNWRIIKPLRPKRSPWSMDTKGEHPWPKSNKLSSLRCSQGWRKDTMSSWIIYLGTFTAMITTKWSGFQRATSACTILWWKHPSKEDSRPIPCSKQTLRSFPTSNPWSWHPIPMWDATSDWISWATGFLKKCTMNLWSKIINDGTRILSLWSIKKSLAKLRQSWLKAREAPKSPSIATRLWCSFQ